MKIVFTGKGGSGKTTLCTWFGEYLALTGNRVWLIDADTTTSLGSANGLASHQKLSDLDTNAQSLCELIASNEDIPNAAVLNNLEHLSIKLPQSDGPSERRLLNLSALANVCSRNPNVFLKTLVSHIDDGQSWILVDLEAGVEHVSRAAAVEADLLVVVSEPSAQSLEAASQISQIATNFGLDKQVLIMNRTEPGTQLGRDDLPRIRKYIPENAALKRRMLIDSDVTGLESREEIFKVIAEIIKHIEKS